MFAGTALHQHIICNVTCLVAYIVFVCYQKDENMNWDIDEAMRRVIESNMSKIDENGKPIRNKNGKVLKGPNYKKPDLSDLV